ncbi:MAG: copper amine oxidase [Xanthomonas sp.]|uniref:DUF411 domain-containing protein n=1 Tax=Pseudoxanthomonas japonensis TaxID=69284 RepID=UPI001D312DCB|nr:copper amine oxidase [Xanthomonas sp.]
MRYRNPLFRCASTVVAAIVITACTQVVPSPVGTAIAAPSPPAKKADTALPRITVHRDAYCGCCHLWVDHLRKEGFEVDDRIEGDMSPVKQRMGVAPEHASCHTAGIGGYVVEGHVPASDIRRLLKERPRIHGLALPGMPVGSPGMEVDGIDAPPYTVLAIGRDGMASPYAEHRP